MNIIVHCKKIKWDLSRDEDSKSTLKVKLPSSCSFKIDLKELQPSSCCGSGSSIEERISAVLDDVVSDILADKFGFCIIFIGSITWEWDPASCTKVVNKATSKVLKAWKRRYHAFYAGYADTLCGDPSKLSNYKKAYVDWMQKNILDKGYTGYTEKESEYSKPISVKIA